MIHAIAFLSFACYLANVALLVWLHLRRTGYSPIRHAVSDYGVGPTRRTFAVYGWLGSAGALALAATLWAADTLPVPAWLLGVLVAMVVARVGVFLLPTDLEGQRLTATGLLHYLFAVLSFAAAYVAVRNLTPIFSHAPGWEPVRGVLDGLAWAATPALVANCVTMLKPLRRVFGICERFFLGVVALWFLTVSATLALVLR
jgi:hypothetical protein